MNSLLRLLVCLSLACAASEFARLSSVKHSAAQKETTGQPSNVVQLVRDALEQVQLASIAENVEYCGYVVANVGGSLKVAGPERGSTFGCRTPLVYKPDVILASFHTHGAFDARTRTEMPSTIDFDAAAAENVDAFIGTPGGRFWYLDFKTATARLLCGPKDCLSRQSPTPKELDDPVPHTLTRSKVLEIERSDPKERR